MSATVCFPVGAGAGSAPPELANVRPFRRVVLARSSTPRSTFPLCRGVRGLVGQDHRAVVLAERLQLGFSSGSNQSACCTAAFRLSITSVSRHAAEMPEGVFQAAEEVFGRLRNGLAVRLAAMRQHDAKDVRLAALAVRR